LRRSSACCIVVQSFGASAIMVNVSPECCPFMLVATLQDHATELPVKNTFIHFPNASVSRSISCVQRFRTDPSSEPRSLLLSSLCDSESADVASTQVSETNSGSSTPLTLEEDSSCSSGDTAFQTLGDGFDQMEEIFDQNMGSTPDVSPCWAPTTKGTQVGFPQLLPWSVVIPIQVQFPSACPVPTQQASFKPATPWQPYPCTALADGSTAFGFTHRRAHGVVWGLHVTLDECRQALLVNAVLPGGAIEAWNRQVMRGPKEDHALVAGDLIVCINSKSNCQEMLEETRMTMLVKVDVLRPPHEQSNIGNLAGAACSQEVYFI